MGVGYTAESLQIYQNRALTAKKTPIAEPAILTTTLLKKLVALMTWSIAYRGTDFMTIGPERATDMPPKCIVARPTVDVDGWKVPADCR